MNATAPRLRPFDSPFGPAPTRKAEMQRANAEVGEILSRLGKCCLPADGSFQWPKRNDLDRLDELVLEIYLWMGPPPKKQNPRMTQPWRRYRAVDRCWPGLRLWRRIEGLLKRARDNTPPRPFGSLRQKPGQPKLVAEFFKILPKIHKDPVQAVSVKWEDFAPLFLDFRSAESNCLQSRLETRLGNVEGGAKLVAYAVYLEIKSDEQAWVRQHGEGYDALTDWVSLPLRNVEFVEMLKCFEAGNDPVLWVERTEREMRQRAQRESAKEQKRRERARKRKNSLKKPDSR